MSRSVRMLVTIATLALAGAHPAMAVVDGEAELRYWDSETEAGPASEGSAAPGLRVEIVLFKRLALAGEYLEPQPEDSLDDTDFKNYLLDAKWRLVAPMRNTFLAIGVGYEKLDISSGGESGSTGSPRVVVDGRIGLVGLLYVYGRGGYLAELSDVTVAGETVLEGDKGYDAEVGLGIEPLPVLSLWVGYRQQTFDFTEPLGDSLSIENSGPFLGAGIHF